MLFYIEKHPMRCPRTSKLGVTDSYKAGCLCVTTSLYVILIHETIFESVGSHSKNRLQRKETMGYTIGNLSNRHDSS